jgi:Arc/MetJ-type ribon-helix-helix transcriptional regulator
MVEEPDDGGDPKVTVRIPEEDLEVIQAAASDEDYSYSQSHIIRYSLDRKFEGREDWETETEPDSELESLIDEYRDELGYGTRVQDQGDEDMTGVSVMLDGDSDLEENSFEYAMTVYTIGVEEGNEAVQELSRQYLEENFPDRDFTKYLCGELFDQ